MKNYPTDDDVPPKSVLILVQQAETLNQISEFCMSLGMLTRAAASSIEAANHIDFEVPDLLILDFDIPAQDGSSFVDFLDSRRAEWRIPTIVLHDVADYQAIKQPKNLFAYFVRRTPNLLPTIRVFAEELIGLSVSATSSTDRIPNSDDQ